MTDPFDNMDIKSLCIALGRLLCDVAPNNTALTEHVAAFTKRVSEEHTRALGRQADLHESAIRDAEDRSFGAGWRHGRDVGIPEGTQAGFESGYEAGCAATRRAWQQALDAYRTAMAAQAVTDATTTAEYDLIKAALAELDEQIAAGKKHVH